MAPNPQQTDQAKKRRIALFTTPIGGVAFFCCLCLAAATIYSAVSPDRADDTPPESTQVAQSAATSEPASDTPPPTEAEPTSTPRPTQTKKPTATDAPTDPAPTLGEPEAAGIGVTRRDLQGYLEILGFTFEAGVDVDRQPNLLGKSETGLALVQLIGPPPELVHASITIFIPNDDTEEVTRNTLYMLLVLQKVLPDWDDGSDWITEQMENANGEDYEAETVIDDVRVKVSVLASLGAVILSFENKDVGLAPGAVNAPATVAPTATRTVTPTRPAPVPTATLTRAPQPTQPLFTDTPIPVLPTATEPPPAANCDPSYPTVCIPPPPPDLDCGDVPYRNFTVLQPDPHRFDGNKDGVGCEG